jgi:hypothetical protein
LQCIDPLELFDDGVFFDAAVGVACPFFAFDVDALFLPPSLFALCFRSSSTDALLLGVDDFKALFISVS